jgi:hypothetical protein
LVIISALVLLNTLSAFYLHGKILYPTTYSKGDIALRTHPDERGLVGYLLAMNAEAVTLFEVEGKAIVTIPREEVIEVRVDKPADVVEVRFGDESRDCTQ